MGICLYTLFEIKIRGAREMAAPSRNPAPQGPGAGVSQAQPQAFSSSPGLQGSQAGEAGAASQPSRSAPKVKKLKLIVFKEEDSHE